MMLLIRKLPCPIIAVFLGMLTTGCNTLEGAGEDVEEAGEAVQDVADDDDDHRY